MPSIVLDNEGLEAAGSLVDLTNANLIVTGNADRQLKTLPPLLLQKLIVDRPGARLSLASDVKVSNGVQLVNGLLNLSGNNLSLLSNSVNSGETETARITGNRAVRFKPPSAFPAWPISIPAILAPILTQQSTQAR